jgi:hypothetical protein
MAITVKHSKVSTIPDDADTSLVRPSDWNADHTLTGTVPVANGGTGASTANDGFNALAPSQTGNSGKYLTTNGTDSSWSVNPLGTVTSVAATAGTGISVSGSPITTSGTLTITNTAPDQTVSIASGTGISATGTYPAFTVTNTLPDQTVVLTAGTGISTSGTYPNFTITNISPSLGGDVVGPASATDNAVARYDTTTGKLIQNSVVTVGDTGATTGITTLSASTSVTTPIVQASNSGGLALKNSGGTTQMSVGAGGGDNMSINVSTNINGTNAQIDISPTGTGHLHMKPTGTGSIEIAPTNAGTMNNMVIGGTTPLAITGTTITATSFVGSGASLTNVVNSLAASTGISVSGATGAVTVTNTAPDQTVVLTAGTGISTSGTYPNFTITNTSPSSGGTVTSVTGTSPVVSSGGNTPAISMPAATTSVNGYLTSTDWTTFNGKAPAVTYTTNYVPYGQGTTTPALSSNFQFNGTTLTLTSDASISGLTVGKGGGASVLNTAVGNVALASNSSGTQNSAFGNGASNSNTSGGNNTAIGYYAQVFNTTGSNNTSVGNQALYANTTASNNTAVGYQAGYNITTGTNNTCIGYNAGANGVAFDGTYSVYVGFQATPSGTGVGSEYVLGTLTGKGSNTFSVGGSSGAYNQANSATWSITSDARLKKNFVDNNTGLDKIASIQVRNFEYRLPEEITEVAQDQAIKKTGVQLGAIAQEIQAVLPECVKQESTGIYTVDTDPLIWYLVNAVKELNAKIIALENK